MSLYHCTDSPLSAPEAMFTVVDMCTNMSCLLLKQWAPSPHISSSLWVYSEPVTWRHLENVFSIKYLSLLWSHPSWASTTCPETVLALFFILTVTRWTSLFPLWGKLRHGEVKKLAQRYMASKYHHRVLAQYATLYHVSSVPRDLGLCVLMSSFYLIS